MFANVEITNLQCKSVASANEKKWLLSFDELPEILSTVGDMKSGIYLVLLNVCFYYKQPDYESRVG